MNEMSASIILLSGYARADEVTRAIFAPQDYFPVMQGDQVIGILCKASLLSALASGEGKRPIVELMMKAEGTIPRFNYERASFPSEN